MGTGAGPDEEASAGAGSGRGAGGGREAPGYGPGECGRVAEVLSRGWGFLVYPQGKPAARVWGFSPAGAAGGGGSRATAGRGVLPRGKAVCVAMERCCRVWDV